MYRFLFLFLIFIFSCGNNISLDKNGWIKDGFLISLGDNYYLKNSKKPYILKDTLVIPKNTVLIFKNNTDLFLKKGGYIINNGSFVLGENNLDSLRFFNNSDIINKIFIYNVKIHSNKNLKIKNNSKLILNYVNLKIN